MQLAPPILPSLAPQCPQHRGLQPPLPEAAAPCSVPAPRSTPIPVPVPASVAVPGHLVLGGGVSLPLAGDGSASLAFVPLCHSGAARRWAVGLEAAVTWRGERGRAGAGSCLRVGSCPVGPCPCPTAPAAGAARGWGQSRGRAPAMLHAPRPGAAGARPSLPCSPRAQGEGAQRKLQLLLSSGGAGSTQGSGTIRGGLAPPPHPAAPRRGPPGRGLLSAWPRSWCPRAAPVPSEAGDRAWVPLLSSTPHSFLLF